MLPLPDPDPVWRLAFWLVLAGAALVCVIAAVILARDFWSIGTDDPRITTMKAQLRALERKQK